MRRAARSFAARAQLRAWLQRHHASATELNLRLFRVHARKRGVAADKKPAGYSFESKPTALAKRYLSQLAANAKA